MHRHRFLGRVLAGTALSSLGIVLPAQAQTQVAETPALEEIVIYGRGETRQVQSVTAATLQLTAPGTSPLKAIEKLPGVSFQSADPFGAYEWSARISIRGFNQNQLGFTLDEVPLGDMSYGAHNGLHVSRAVISENLDRVVVAQGAGALGTASTSNLGGTLQFVSRDPSEEAGISTALTGGENATRRAYVRLETGALATGTRAYASYAGQWSDKWKGDGIQKQQQMNAKVVQPVGEGTITGWINWSDRRENDYQDLSRSMIGRLGYDWDNFAKNWNLALQVADIGNNRGDSGAPVSNPAAGTVYPAPVQTLDDAYYDAAGLRKDTLGAVTLDYPLGSILSVSATGYGHRNEGQGVWFTPYVPTPGGGPISIRTTEYDIERYGVIGRLTADLGDHRIEAGGWYEDNDFSQARRFYGLDRAAPQRSSTQFQSSPFYTQWDYDFTTTTRQLYIADTWAVTDMLTLNGGFKAVKVENEADTVTGPERSGTIEAKDSFLPQVSARLALTEDQELFASYTENIRAFVSAATSGPFSTTPEGFAAIRDSLEPETSQTVELGWRFRVDTLQGSVTGYYVKFDDRLLTLSLGAGIVGNPTALQNVGSVTTKGVEAAATWEFVENWSVFGSLTYNDSKYDDNVLDANGVITAATKDKKATDTPEFMAKGELAYDDGDLFGTVGVSHTGKRYYTYLNNGSVPSYTLVDVSLGYRFSGSGWLDGLEVQANVTNLFDKEYVSTIGSNGFTNADPNGTFQTLLAGAPQQFFVTLRKSF
ncbi:TonB-dependent receptor [Rhodocista pekingensis]|uniref:TonB-dependent receptor n=1 Tax=Rhodocista pekingensis TaxID=201185 RepID=A0ABW2KT33_9PROT